MPIPLADLYRPTKFFELSQAVRIAEVPILFRREGEHMVIPWRDTSEGTRAGGVGAAIAVKRHSRLPGRIGKKYDFSVRQRLLIRIGNGAFERAPVGLEYNLQFRKGRPRNVNALVQHIAVAHPNTGYLKIVSGAGGGQREIVAAGQDVRPRERPDATWL